MAEQPNLPIIPDFYANMVNFGNTIWDIRMIFGQMIQRGGEEVFDPKLAVTLPWLQAKAMSVYLQLNIFFHEKTNGKIEIPSHLLPSPVEPSEEITDPNIRASYELVRKKLAQILATMEDLNPSSSSTDVKE
jgi:hypothetical protein